MIIRLKETANHWCSYANPASLRNAFPIKKDGTPDMSITIPVEHQGCLGPACASWRWTRPLERFIPIPEEGKVSVEFIDWQGFCGRSGARHEEVDHFFHDDIEKLKPVGNLSGHTIK